MNKDLQLRAAKCEGLELIVYHAAPGSRGDIGYKNHLTNYDNWNNVMRLRDLAIEKRGGAYCRLIYEITGGVIEYATKEQVVEAAVGALESLESLKARIGAFYEKETT